MRLKLLSTRLRNIAKKPFYALYQKKLEASALQWKLPKHIGIILDGNRRFARLEGLTKAIDGHARGADKLEELLEWCYQFRIPVITIWIFSLDNFQRDKEEVDGLFRLIEEHTRILTDSKKIHQRRVKLRFIGRIELLPNSLQDAIIDAQKATERYEDFILNIAIAYGGREEITDAMGRYLQDGMEKGKSVLEMQGALQPEQLTPYLYTSGLPEPDLLIRTSGEIRMSGFLLWQSAHSEFYFCDILWPEFRKLDFLRALRSYELRNRRFGR